MDDKEVQMTQILLRNLTSYLNSESPSDWVMLIKDVTLAASGLVVVDLKGYVRPGAIVKYVLLSQANVMHLATATTDGLTVTKGSAVIGSVASTETNMQTKPVNVIPAASKTTTALIFYRHSDQALSGESFV